MAIFLKFTTLILINEPHGVSLDISSRGRYSMVYTGWSAAATVYPRD